MATPAVTQVPTHTVPALSSPVPSQTASPNFTHFTATVPDKTAQPGGVVGLNIPTQASGALHYITPVSGNYRPVYRTLQFHYGDHFKDDLYTIRIPINMSVYYGAKQSTLQMPVVATNSEELFNYAYSMRNEPAMNELYDDLITELRNCRYQKGNYLSDDEYLEMIVSFVQQIPLSESTSLKRRYPVEVIYENRGDVDEKANLLVNLLSREGYATSQMVFADEHYVGVGIPDLSTTASPNLRTFSNGKVNYLFIDMSKPAFIGDFPDRFRNAGDPVIFPIGNGNKTYGEINSVWNILTDVRTLENHNLTTLATSILSYPWDREGTCLMIKNAKLESRNLVCYCCD